MCLIVFTPDISKAVIRKSVLMRGFEGNDDGCGFSYIENGEIKLHKGYFSFKGFYKKYLEVRNRVKTGPFLIHFRASTCGVLSKTNSQPIYVNKNLVMAHNGTFHDLELFNENLSDSVTMAKHLGEMGLSLPLNRGYKEILNILCMGIVNKLVFFDVRGNWDIINSQLGMWRNHAWYSDKGECLCKETYPGYYKLKTWKKFQNLVPNRGEAPKIRVKKTPNLFESKRSSLYDTPRFNQPSKPKVEVKQTLAFPPLRPPAFGGPSKIMRPTVYNEPFYRHGI